MSSILEDTVVNAVEMNPSRDDSVQQPEYEPKEKKQSKRARLRSIGQMTTVDEIEKAIRQTFQQSQRTISIHKTQVAILKAVFERCQQLELGNVFNETFCRLVDKVLPLKRNEDAGNRIVRFVSAFTTAISKDKENDAEATRDSDITEEAVSEFISILARHLMRGLESTNRDVRYRVCHFLSYLMHNMTSIDRELYDSMSTELLNRLYDKDASVRSKAIATLACFGEADNAPEISDAAKRIRTIMQNDTNAEVRRVCMRVIEKGPFTNEYIFERARDENSVNRRLVFSAILPKYEDFRTIDSADRNKLLEYGLRDRDEHVRKAAVKWLTDCWLPTCGNDLMEVIGRLKVTESNIADTALRALLDAKAEMTKRLQFPKEVIEDLSSESALLLRVFFQYCNDNNSEDAIDKNFPEAAKFAEVLKLYFDRRRKNLFKIEDNSEKLANEEATPEELGILDPEEYDYIILQLLIIASEYDYHDEFGRSKMLSVLRSILSEEGLNNKIVDYLILCIRKLSISERDFSQIIVDIVNDLNDSAAEKLALESDREGNETAVPDATEKQQDSDEDDDDDSDNDDDDFVDAATSMTEETIRNANKSRQEALEKEKLQISQLPPEVLVEALTMTKRMLELVNEPLKDNMYLESILYSLIRPALQRTEVEIRILALKCMGLCCVLDKGLAIQNMFLCGVFVTKSDNDEMIKTGLQVIADLLAVHGVSILGVDAEGSIDAMAVAKLFYRTLRDSQRKEVQAVSGEALYKLFLSGIINDDQLFETTLLAYFNPTINDNEALKQCLTFCIPTYAFSHPSHQEQISRVVGDTLSRLFENWDQMIEEAGPDHGKSILHPAQIIDQLRHWTDPYILAAADGDEDAAKSSVQVEMGIQLLKTLEDFDNSTRNRPFIKAIFSSLPKLTFTEEAPLNKLQQLHSAIESDALLQGELDDALQLATNRNNFAKFRSYADTCLTKALEATGEVMTAMDDDSANKDTEQFSTIQESSSVMGPSMGLKIEHNDDLKNEQDDDEIEDDTTATAAEVPVKAEEDTLESIEASVLKDEEEPIGHSSFADADESVDDGSYVDDSVSASFEDSPRKRRAPKRKTSAKRQRRTRRQQNYDSDSSIIVLSDDE